MRLKVCFISCHRVPACLFKLRQLYLGQLLLLWRLRHLQIEAFFQICAQHDSLLCFLHRRLVPFMLFKVPSDDLIFDGVRKNVLLHRISIIVLLLLLLLLNHFRVNFRYYRFFQVLFIAVRCNRAVEKLPHRGILHRKDLRKPRLFIEYDVPLTIQRFLQN